jgi:hypothetical protein
VQARADKAVTLPVGWAEGKGRSNLLRALGWALSAFALMQGGPFWFNLLSREISWRGGASPDTKTAAASG